MSMTKRSQAYQRWAEERTREHDNSHDEYLSETFIASRLTHHVIGSEHQTFHDRGSASPLLFAFTRQLIDEARLSKVRINLPSPNSSPCSVVMTDDEDVLMVRIFDQEGDMSSMTIGNGSGEFPNAAWRFAGEPDPCPETWWCSVQRSRHLDDGSDMAKWLFDAETTIAVVWSLMPKEHAVQP